VIIRVLLCTCTRQSNCYHQSDDLYKNSELLREENARSKKGAIVRKNAEKESKDSGFAPCKITLSIADKIQFKTRNQTIINYLQY
jgi:hypothetical protein